MVCGVSYKWHIQQTRREFHYTDSGNPSLFIDADLSPAGLKVFFGIDLCIKVVEYFYTLKFLAHKIRPYSKRKALSYRAASEYRMPTRVEINTE